MLFPTFAFVCFFGAVFSVYWLLKTQQQRLFWLLGASAFFYMSWNPWLISLILFTASVDFTAARALERIDIAWKRKALLIGSIAINLCLLGFFKYVNFFLDSAWALESWLGIEVQRRSLQLILPLGISFYTFETISYIVDVYRGRIRALRNPLHYAVFILFFPHLVAGPIVRTRDFIPQMRRFRRPNWDRLQLGLQFFLIGVLKKAAFADQLALAIDPVFAAPSAFSSLAIWLAVVGYAAQIYLDFSGYSDMAVGLAHMLGYRLPKNFNLPYLAGSIAEFWRRWHISLSTWLRDYLFIPLGGSRGGVWSTCRNLMIVMLLGGLWHGANWTFVFWGFYHGVLLVLHRLLGPYWPDYRWLRPFNVAGTFLAVCIGWVFFRARSFADAWLILERMFAPTAGMALTSVELRCVVAVLLATAAGYGLAAGINLRRVERAISPVWLGGVLAAILVIALLLVPEQGKAFLYFQF